MITILDFKIISRFCVSSAGERILQFFVIRTRDLARTEFSGDKQKFGEATLRNDLKKKVFTE